MACSFPLTERSYALFYLRALTLVKRDPSISVASYIARYWFCSSDFPLYHHHIMSRYISFCTRGIGDGVRLKPDSLLSDFLDIWRFSLLLYVLSSYEYRYTYSRNRIFYSIMYYIHFLNPNLL